MRQTTNLWTPFFRTLAKIFETFSQDIINACRMAFNLPSVTDIINKQKINFLVRYSASENLLCKVLESNAEREIKAMRQKIRIELLYVGNSSEIM